MNWFRKLMQGRYGGDQLSFVLLIISILIGIFATIFNIPYLNYVSYLPLIFAVYRMFSKNIYKRQQENYKFLRLFGPIKKKINQTKTKVKDTNHKYYRCTSCKTTLRVPKGKGKITITCPKCKNKIIKKT